MAQENYEGIVFCGEVAFEEIKDMLLTEGVGGILDNVEFRKDPYLSAESMVTLCPKISASMRKIKAMKKQEKQE